MLLLVGEHHRWHSQFNSEVFNVLWYYWYTGHPFIVALTDCVWFANLDFNVLIHMGKFKPEIISLKTIGYGRDRTQNLAHCNWTLYRSTTSAHLQYCLRHGRNIALAWDDKSWPIRPAINDHGLGRNLTSTLTAAGVFFFLNYLIIKVSPRHKHSSFMLFVVRHFTILICNKIQTRKTCWEQILFLDKTTWIFHPFA